MQWVKRYLFFHGMRHPKDKGKPEIETPLTALAAKFPNAPKKGDWHRCRFFHRSGAVRRAVKMVAASDWGDEGWSKTAMSGLRQATLPVLSRIRQTGFGALEDSMNTVS